jgi:RLL motif-containing protein 1
VCYCNEILKTTVSLLLDEKQFRSTIVWLEDQKVRRYKIEDRESLRNTTAEHWNQAFEQYLKDLDCPFANGSRPEIVDWLLGLAVQFEFNEKPESYTSSPKIQQQTSQQSNPLDNLDCNKSFLFQYFLNHC